MSQPNPCQSRLHLLPLMVPGPAGGDGGVLALVVEGPCMTSRWVAAEALATSVKQICTPQNPSTHYYTVRQLQEVKGQLVRDSW